MKVEERLTVTHLQIGICMALSALPSYSPASCKAFTTATLAWNRFMPYPNMRLMPRRSHRYTYLELLTRVFIKRTVIVQNIDEWQVMADSNLVIVWIMRRGDLHSAGTELHVDDDVVRDDGDAAVEEGVFGEFTVEMCVSGVIRVYSYSSITQHSLRTSRGNDDFLVWQRYCCLGNYGMRVWRCTYQIRLSGMQRR